MDISKEDVITAVSLGVLTWKVVLPILILPSEPIPIVSLPIHSQFDKGVLEPFMLRSAPTPSPDGVGNVRFLDGNLVFQNYLGWTLLGVRVPRQNTISAKWVWKGSGIPEVWCAYPWRFGRTVMIQFVNGEARQVLYGKPVRFLCKVDVNEWVEMATEADYEAGTANLSINNQDFSLEILDEPIGQADYVQFQFSLQGLARVTIREMSLS